MNAVRLEAVERRRIQEVPFLRRHPGEDVPDGQVDTPDPGQHPRLVRRVKFAVVINDYVIGAEEIGIPQVDVIVGARPERASQALGEIVLLQPGARSVVEVDQVLYELAVERVPSLDIGVDGPTAPREALVIDRPQIDRAHAAGAVGFDELVEVWGIVDVDRGQCRNLVGSQPLQCLIQVAQEPFGGRSRLRSLPGVGGDIAVEGSAHESVRGVEEGPFLRSQPLKVGADDEPGRREPPATERPYLFEQIQAQQGFAALELDLDVNRRQSIEVAEHGLGRILAPIVTASVFGRARDLTVRAGQVAPEGRYQDHVAKLGSDGLPLAPAVREARVSEITGLFETVAAEVKESLVPRRQPARHVPIQERGVSAEKSSGVVAEQIAVRRPSSKSQRPNLHRNTTLISASRIERVSA